MVTEIVIDSSVIVALATLENYSPWARSKLSEHKYFHILDLTYYEVANAIRYKQSINFGKQEAQAAIIKSVELLDLFGVHSFGEVVIDAMSLAMDLNIAVYDAAYLCLADKLEIRFLTTDIKLAKKLENTKFSGVPEYPNPE